MWGVLERFLGILSAVSDVPSCMLWYRYYSSCCHVSIDTCSVINFSFNMHHPRLAMAWTTIIVACIVPPELFVDSVTVYVVDVSVTIVANTGDIKVINLLLLL